MNTASSGGFPSLSDSFRSALWATEHMLKMGFTNLFGGNIYVGGVIDPYIPFLSPRTNMSTHEKGTIFSIFYGLFDLLRSCRHRRSDRLRRYRTKQGTVARSALFNYITDASSASNYVVTLALGGATSAQTSSPGPSLSRKILPADVRHALHEGRDARGRGADNDGGVRPDGADVPELRAHAGLALLFLSSGAIDLARTTTATLPTMTATNPMASATVRARHVERRERCGSRVAEQREQGERGRGVVHRALM
ncbi:hypothetical protein B0H21DRAFT_525399 [Amylocystis lapponica]|nr:hypothetical protein B0H21DRAFT_134530 [Amylocystis lapponica]KAH9942084.1 hypothetical protein B0H21DRAFT_525399 [Amylocystis lapponica]